MLRNIWTDLVEKRLWPVAAALVIALVAVPVVLGRSGGSSSPAGDAAAANPVSSPTATPANQVVTYAVPTKGHAVRARPHDPFPAGAKKPQTPSSQASAPTSATTTTASATPPAARPLSGTTTAPGAPVGPGPNTVKPPKPGTPAGYRVDVTWGPSGDTKARTDLLRLTPLNPADAQPTDPPVLIFLGVKDDHRTAVFLVADGAKKSGDGKCRPSAAHCVTVELREAESAFFDVTTPSGVVQYELDIDRVGVRKVADKAAAAKVLERESKPGRKALKAAIATGNVDYVSRYQYSKRRGVLIFHRKRRVATASAFHPSWMPMATTVAATPPVLPAP